MAAALRSKSCRETASATASHFRYFILNHMQAGRLGNTRVEFGDKGTIFEESFVLCQNRHFKALNGDPPEVWQPPGDGIGGAPRGKKMGAGRFQFGSKFSDPQRICKGLDKFVIGREKSQKDRNPEKKCSDKVEGTEHEAVELEKSNILVMGPTGSDLKFKNIVNVPEKGARKHPRGLIDIDVTFVCQFDENNPCPYFSFMAVGAKTSMISPIGFGAPVRTNMRTGGVTSAVVTSSLLETVESSDLISYGLIPGSDVGPVISNDAVIVDDEA
nr:CLP protease regulatory subunit CLPX1, mitochondrial [Ipomoea batatas]